MDFDVDEALSLDDDEAELEPIDVPDDQVEATMVIQPGALPGAVEADSSDTQIEIEADEDVSDIATGSEDVAVKAAINLGLDDTSDISDAIFMDPADDTNISEIELGMDDIAVDDVEIDGEGEADDFLLDLDSKPVKTGTFAPGDFEDPEEIIASETDITGVNLDDIDDLVLPDDVDEVSTKLDLARAFIEMGDAEGARSSLDEVLKEGNEEQKAEAEDLIKEM
jgi:pilus assembly protein FimV